MSVKINFLQFWDPKVEEWTGIPILDAIKYLNLLPFFLIKKMIIYFSVPVLDYTAVVFVLVNTFSKNEFVEHVKNLTGHYLISANKKISKWWIIEDKYFISCSDLSSFFLFLHRDHHKQRALIHMIHKYLYFGEILINTHQISLPY